MIPLVTRTVREIPTHLIDRPENPMRELFDDDAFRELVEDIACNGIQIPLIVEHRHGRYAVCAGDRRLQAAKVLEAVTVPCDVREPGELDEEAIKVLENDVREDVNAYDAALYLQRLLEGRGHGDVDQVCAIVKRKRGYVEDRLLLLGGDPDVLEAMKRKRITFGVAKELNQIKDLGYRRLHLDQALKVGMTVQAAKDARRDSNAVLDRSTSRANGEDAPSGTPVTLAPAPYTCRFCARSDHVERMRYLMVHEHCDLVFERLIEQFRTVVNADAPQGQV